MTNEPIMIDDVNVLNCGYFSQFEGKTENACYIQPRKVIGSDVNIGFGSCDTSPNCYYKQLKRKEQECEELLKFNNSLVEEHKTIGNDLYKEFKDMAKEGLDNYKDVGGCWGCGISFSFDELLKSYKKLEYSYYQATKESPTATRINAKFNKYEKALQEIKKIAEDDCKTCTVKLLGEDKINCKRCYETKILQKCEVIND